MRINILKYILRSEKLKGKSLGYKIVFYRLNIKKPKPKTKSSNIQTKKPCLFFFKLN